MMHFNIVYLKTYTLLSSTYPSRSNKRVLGDLIKPSLLFKTTRDVGHVDPDAMVKSKERGMSPCKHWELIRDVSNFANRSRDISRAVEHRGYENLVIYASIGPDKIVCTSIHPPLHVSGCEMADLLTRSPRHILSVSNLVLDIHVIFNWQLSKKDHDIRRPVSHDCIPASQELHLNNNYTITVLSPSPPPPPKKNLAFP